MVSKKSQGVISASIAFCVTLLWATTAHAQNDRLVDEVKQKYSSFREVAKFLQANARSKRTFFSSKYGDTNANAINAYKQNANCVLMLEKQADAEPEIIYCINQKYGFVLGRKPGKDWVLSDLCLEDPGDVKYGGSNLREHVLRAVSAGYGVDLLGNITTAREETSGEKSYVVLEYERSSAEKMIYQTKGRMVFERSLGLPLIAVESVSKFETPVKEIAKS